MPQHPALPHCSGLHTWRVSYSLILLVSLALAACSQQATIQDQITSLAEDPSSSNWQNPYIRHDKILQELVEIGEPAVLPLIAALENPENELQLVYAAMTLGRIGDPRAIEPLLTAYGGRWGQHAILEALIALAPDDPRITQAAIQGLGQGGTHEKYARAFLGEQGIQNIEYWVEGLTNPNINRREDTLELLLEFGGLPAARAIAGTLASDDTEVLQTAVHILDEMTAGENAEHAVTAAGENISRLVELVSHPDRDISIQATNLLLASPSPEAFEALYNLRGTGNWQILGLVLKLLVERNDPRASEALWEALIGPENVPDDLDETIMDLLEQSGAYQIEPIVAALDSDNPQVRANAIAALGMSRDPEALPYLRDLAFALNESPSIRHTAVLGLGEFDSAVPDLVKLLDDQDDQVKLHALSALQDIGSEESVAVQISVCKDHDYAVWDAACLHLATLDREQVAPLLAAISRKDYQTISQAYPFFIAWGEEGSEFVLIQALESYGDKGMAVDFLNCGNDLMAQAGKAWAKAHNFTVISLPGSGGSNWGSAK